MNCNQCTVAYNTTVHKPIVLFDCFHYLCNDCVSKIEDNKCPKCKQEIKSKAVNWDTLELVEQNANSGSVAENTTSTLTVIEPENKKNKPKNNNLNTTPMVFYFLF